MIRKAIQEDSADEMAEVRKITENGTGKHDQSMGYNCELTVSIIRMTNRCTRSRSEMLLVPKPSAWAPASWVQASRPGQVCVLGDPPVLVPEVFFRRYSWGSFYRWWLVSLRPEWPWRFLNFFDMWPTLEESGFDPSCVTIPWKSGMWNTLKNHQTQNQWKPEKST